MSDILAEVKKQRLAARKARDTNVVSILTTLVGELETRSKKEGKATTDETVIATCKKFIDNNVDTIENSGDFSTELLEAENEILKAFMPTQLTAEDLRAIIIELAPSNIGQAFGHLTANYAGQYDGKVASEIVKEIV